MTTSNGAVKNAETAGASNFDLYAGDFSCDDDISFENLLQLDNDIDKPPPSTSLQQQGTVSPAAQLCRQPPQPPPDINSAQPSSITGSAALPPSDTVVYLFTTSALRPPSSSGGAAVYDAVARNDVRPLLRFQISKRPTTTAAAAAVVGYGVELGAPLGSGAAQPRPPAGLGLPTAASAGCDLQASVASVEYRVAPPAAGCPPSSSDGQQLQRRLALTTAFNGDLTTPTQRSLAAAVVAGGTSPVARQAKSIAQPLSGGGAVNAAGSSKSKSAADARQTVQEKNAYEYERVMDILRYYRELVVERKLPGACLPCKRRKSKPLVSADPLTPISTRPAPLHPPPPSTSTVTTRTVAVPATQYVRPAAMSSWRVRTPTTEPRLHPATDADKMTTVAASTSTSRPPVPDTHMNGVTSAMLVADYDHDVSGRTGSLAGESATDEPPPSRPFSVELGTMHLHPVSDDILDCSKDLTRSCSSAPGLCDDDDDDDDGRRNPLTIFDYKTSLDRRRLPPSVLGGNRRHRTLRRSVDLRHFTSRPLSFLQRELRARKSDSTTDGGSGNEFKDDAPESNTSAWIKATLPVKHISTRTTDTVVMKWTKAHLAISGPYQSWT